MSAISEATRMIDVSGQRARLYDSGSGDPVVVLHGWGGRIESMAPVLAGLTSSFRVVALDLPGFGESPTPDGVWGTPDYASFVLEALTDAGIERAHFVGHSFGAKISLYLAATHPDLVDRMVLQGSSGLRTPPSMRARVKRMVSKSARHLERFGAPGKKLRAMVYDRIASEDYKNAGPIRPILVRVVNENLEAILPNIKASTLLVWGTSDDAVPVGHAKTMERLIPDAGLVLFEGAGHFAYLDESERFIRVVRHFLGAPLGSGGTA
ncbi:MAG: alpha/beta fold hydrolase [Actinomycetota bacterium]